MYEEKRGKSTETRLYNPKVGTRLKNFSQFSQVF